LTVSAMEKQPPCLFEENPERFIEDAVRLFVRESVANRLADFGGAPIFEEPLIGFADGDDPLFGEFKKVVSEEHLLPREILARHLQETLNRPDVHPDSVSVISFVLPVNRETLRTNASEKEGPSLRWNHTRWKGQDFILALSANLAALLQTMGVYALVPELSSDFKMMMIADGFTSTWSQRHIAYAAGLGTFSLNEGFITARGMAMRLGSVVAGMKLKPSARPYQHFRANCLFYAGGKCGKCISRCPGGAITEHGHDKLKCFEVLYKMQAPWLNGEHGPGYIGKYAGCGLCQTGVPCADRIPVKETAG